MAISRRQLIQAAALSTLGGAGAAFSQQYPSKPIRLVVPATAGTAIDLTARFVAEALSNRLKTPVVIDNRAGAGGAIGSDLVAKATPDGYTLVFPGIVHFTTRYLPDSAVTYDPVKDFTAIAKLNGAALAIVVPTASPYKTLSDLVQAMKAKPGEVTYGTGGNGSTSHLCSVLLNDITQTSARHVPYKGNTPAVTDTVGGQVDFTCQGSAGVLPLIKAGRLRALAVTSRGRWDTLPEVPTGIEAGIPGFEISSWIAVMGPAALPAPIVTMLSDELVRIGNSAEFKEFCAKQAMFVDVADYRSFQADMPKEEARWKRIVKLAGNS